MSGGAWAAGALLTVTLDPDEAVAVQLAAIYANAFHASEDLSRACDTSPMDGSEDDIKAARAAFDTVADALAPAAAVGWGRPPAPVEIKLKAGVWFDLLRGGFGPMCSHLSDTDVLHAKMLTPDHMDTLRRGIAEANLWLGIEAKVTAANGGTPLLPPITDDDPINVPVGEAA